MESSLVGKHLILKQIERSKWETSDCNCPGCDTPLQMRRVFYVGNIHHDKTICWEYLCTESGVIWTDDELTALSKRELKGGLLDQLKKE